MKVITISGHAESGKDTVAKQLKWQIEDQKFDSHVVIIHYADMLKFICRQCFGWNGQKDDKGRNLLQKVGTDIVRAKDPNFWVDMMVKVLKVFDDVWDVVIIPDCRFPNEADTMKEQFGAVCVKVVRPGYTNHLTEEQRNHPSETSMDDYQFDYVINNPGDEGLEQNVTDFIFKCL